MFSFFLCRIGNNDEFGKLVLKIAKKKKKKKRGQCDDSFFFWVDWWKTYTNVGIFDIIAFICMLVGI